MVKSIAAKSERLTTEQTCVALSSTSSIIMTFSLTVSIMQVSSKFSQQ
jgi:hypothetical protein